MAKENGTIWVVGKNGNFCGAFSDQPKAVAGMRVLAKAPKAEISDQKDGSVRLKDVRHYRAKPVILA